MYRTHFQLAITCIASVVMLSLVGCSKEQASPPPSAETATVEQSHVDVPAEFAELAEADQIAAMAQKICPVSDQKLGSMGTPIKATVQGRDIFLCCEGCKEELMADPNKYLAKLDAK